LALLVCDPSDLQMLDEVAFVTGKQVHPIVVPEARIWALLRDTYGLDRQLRGIEVDFAGEIHAKPVRVPPAHKDTVAQDLMDEGAFDAMYGQTGASARVLEPAPAMPSAPRPAPATPAPLPPPPEWSLPRVVPPAVPPPPSSLPAAAVAPPPPSTPAPPAAWTGVPPPPPMGAVEAWQARAPGGEQTEVIRLNAVEEEILDLTEELPAEALPPPAVTPIPHLPFDIAAEVAAVLRAGPGHVAPSHFVPAAAPARSPEPEPTPVSFDEALSLLAGVDDRHAIARTVLRYARSKFKRAVLFTVQRGEARGWAGLGEKVSAQNVARMRLPLDAPGAVSMVVGARAHFLGPLPKTDANVRLLKYLGGGVPANSFLVPILALGRVVNVLYADNGKGGQVDSSDLGELLILATKIAQSYDVLLARAAQA
ncbi:MAG TPA: hypothetical protein VLT61_09615, partial [Anaeromyxobacteraceae bacterium]|nr:hypothetical protein [Anaeromyxobacteraceae bacterium]